MALRPENLLSKTSRTQCIANIKELPTFIAKGTPYFISPDSLEGKLASVLVPLCVINDEVCLLYTLRSSKLTSHRGQVSFPGGKRDENESVFDTALRETEEEIGFPRELVDIWTELNPVQGRDKNMVITPVVGQLLNFDPQMLTINSDEVEEVFSVSMSMFCDPNNHAHFMFKNLPLPVNGCGKHRVWGITGMITHLFLSTFLPNDLYKPNFINKSYLLEELMPAKL